VARSIFQGATRQLMNRRVLNKYLTSVVHSNIRKGSIAGDSWQNPQDLPPSNWELTSQFRLTKLIMYMSDVEGKCPRLKITQAPNNPWVLTTDPDDWNKGELQMFDELHEIFQKQMDKEMRIYKSMSPKKYLQLNEVIFLRLT
jgi:hypothetical protein